ncbi:ribose 5-phosphate isomerase B [Collibacillus ludicampi]|jgi:ribose 5-phosphate isomerase B|uniref:Ribose 5-phosphate isomerase B n=1 Tax=Collibacillus ludicampi TaxID=2771369 RepID=A0AAV4LDJ0_9BACL|nr:ribose 5-phosphate isomerase B [Collibacillus ludicampi]GIM45723.1 ribose 5-phosphate isomerase B [Collibacillus ludicampi]
MKIALAADHGGYALKEHIKTVLDQMGLAYKDFGTYSEESVDYPDYGLQVSKAVANGEYDRGILFCGTGLGMSIVANKVPGVRCALVHDCFSAKATRQHNDTNVLAMGGRVIGPGLAEEIVRIWLTTEFEGGRHARRLDKIRQIEQEYGQEEGVRGC